MFHDLSRDSQTYTIKQITVFLGSSIHYNNSWSKIFTLQLTERVPVCHWRFSPKLGPSDWGHECLSWCEVCRRRTDKDWDFSSVIVTPTEISSKVSQGTLVWQRLLSFQNSPWLHFRPNSQRVVCFYVLFLDPPKLTERVSRRPSPGSHTDRVFHKDRTFVSTVVLCLQTSPF